MVTSCIRYNAAPSARPVHLGAQQAATRPNPMVALQAAAPATAQLQRSAIGTAVSAAAGGYPAPGVGPAAAFGTTNFRVPQRGQPPGQPQGQPQSQPGQTAPTGVMSAAATRQPVVERQGSVPRRSGSVSMPGPCRRSGSVSVSIPVSQCPGGATARPSLAAACRQAQLDSGLDEPAMPGPPRFSIVLQPPEEQRRCSGRVARSSIGGASSVPAPAAAPQCTPRRADQESLVASCRQAKFDSNPDEPLESAVGCPQPRSSVAVRMRSSISSSQESGSPISLVSVPTPQGLSQLPLDTPPKARRPDAQISAAAPAPSKGKMQLPISARGAGPDSSKPAEAEETRRRSLAAPSPIYIKTELHKEFAEAKLPKRFFKVLKKQRNVESQQEYPRNRGSISDWKRNQSTTMENIWDNDSEDDSDSSRGSLATFRAK